MKSALSIFLVARHPARRLLPGTQPRQSPRRPARLRKWRSTSTASGLSEISEALFYQPGLIPITPSTPRTANTPSPNSPSPPMPRSANTPLRLRGPGGITELRSFWVGQFPSVAEIEPNDTFEQAQRVEPQPHRPRRRRQRGRRLLRLHPEKRPAPLRRGRGHAAWAASCSMPTSPFSTRNASNSPPATTAPLLRNDAFASVIAPEDGDYRIVVREAAYEGNDNCQYRLHIGTFPRPTAVFPTGGKPGETVEFTFIGDPSGPIQQSITLPVRSQCTVPCFSGGQTACRHLRRTGSPFRLWTSVR